MVWLQSSTQVVSRGLVYASMCLHRRSLVQLMAMATDRGVAKGFGRGGKNALVNVCLRREIRWVAADIVWVWWLVHAHIVDQHVCREYQVAKVNLRGQRCVRQHEFMYQAAARKTDGDGDNAAKPMQDKIYVRMHSRGQIQDSCQDS
jgi:hypothetical protein